jgi:hypothetical protein
VRPPAGVLPNHPGGVKAKAGAKDARKPARQQGALGAKFAKGAFSAADDVPLWVYVLLALAIALLGAAAFLPKNENVGLSTSLLLGLMGATLLLGITLAYAFG